MASRRPRGTTLTHIGKSGGRASPAIARAGRSRVLRIIGGSWRGRRLRFPALADIRPTPDRVRETLFNWLGAHIRGARCLDLFAGSGALGLEALSRGAAHVTFVERDRLAVRELRARLTEWGATGAQVLEMDASRFLDGEPEAFDIVFLDPPFASDLLPRSARTLEAGGWLDDRALIYVETDSQSPLPALPPSWNPAKAKQAGAVGYHLFIKGAAAE